MEFFHPHFIFSLKGEQSVEGLKSLPLEREGTQVLFLHCVSLDFINQTNLYIGDIGPFSFVFIFVPMFIVSFSFCLILVNSFVVFFLTFYHTAVMTSRAQLGM